MPLMRHYHYPLGWKASLGNARRCLGVSHPDSCRVRLVAVERHFSPYLDCRSACNNNLRRQLRNSASVDLFPECSDLENWKIQLLLFGVPAYFKQNEINEYRYSEIVKNISKTWTRFCIVFSWPLSILDGSLLRISIPFINSIRWLKPITNFALTSPL